jgi:hypothetical protein
MKLESSSPIRHRAWHRMQWTKQAMAHAPGVVGAVRASRGSCSVISVSGAKNVSSFEEVSFTVHLCSMTGRESARIGSSGAGYALMGAPCEPSDAPNGYLLHLERDHASSGLAAREPDVDREQVLACLQARQRQRGVERGFVTGVRRLRARERQDLWDQ